MSHNQGHFFFLLLADSANGGRHFLGERTFLFLVHKRNDSHEIT